MPAAVLPNSRRRLLAYVSALLAALGVLVLPGTALAGPDEGDFFSAVNAARAANGVRSLAWSSELADVARRQAERMASSGDLEHNPNLGNEVTGWRVVSENIGYGPTWRSIQNAFMASSEHRANLLDPEVTQLGVGTAVDKHGTLWVSQVFRLPYGASAPSGGSSSAGTAPSSGGTAAVATTWTPAQPSPEQLLRDRIRAARDKVARAKHRQDDPLTEALDFSTVMNTVAR